MSISHADLYLYMDGLMKNGLTEEQAMIEIEKSVKKAFPEADLSNAEMIREAMFRRNNGEQT